MGYSAKRQIYLMMAASAICAAAAVPAAAQSDPSKGAEATPSTNTVSDLIITAQKRSERLQSVPITVSAVTGNTVEALGIHDTRDLQVLVPGLVFNRNLTAGIPVIRGISHNIGTIGDEAPVATYVDGVYVPNNLGSMFALNNIERIEVLKGPQGTLFGRNATGGVIQVITKTPQHQFSGTVSADYANYDTLSGNLYLTGGLSDNVAADLAAYWSDQKEGWGRNVLLNIPIFKNSDLALRSKILWQPGANTDVTLAASYNHNTGYQGSTYGIYPGSLGIDRSTRFISPFDTADDIPTDNRNTTTNGSLTIRHSFGNVEALDILAYQDVRSYFALDQNAVAGATCAGCQAVNVLGNERGGTWSNEFQLSYHSDGGVSLIGGLFALHDISRYEHDIFGQFGLGILPQELNARQKTDSLAVFAQGTTPLGKSTRLTLGARYTTDERTLSGQLTPLAGFPNSVTAFPASVVTSVSPTLPPSSRWSKPTWRVSLDHDLTTDVMVFASYNRGFKSGTYAIANLANPPVRPEVLDAFEAGVKSTLLDRKLRFNASTFFYKYKDIQLRKVEAGSVFLLNAAQAEVKGLDVDTEFVPIENFKITAGFEILDAHYTSFPNAPVAVPNPIGGNKTIFVDATGNTMIRAPKFTSSLAASYTLPTSSGDFSVDANWSHNSGFYWEFSDRTRQPAFDVVNASLGWIAANRRLYARIWARNLFDETYYAAVAEGQSDIASPEAPRTYGLTVGYNF